MRALPRLAQFGALTALAACATQTPPLPERPLHMLVMKCVDGAGVEHHSRVTVLDAGTDEVDYALATAHSLRSGFTCRVEDNRGDSRDVLRFAAHPDYRPGEGAGLFVDWGVVAFPRFERDGLVRFALDRSEDAEPANTALLPRGRGRLHNTKPCAISYRDARVPPLGGRRAYPTYSCRTQGGQSGTPMTVVRADGRHVLIGMVTGRTFFYPDRTEASPGWYGRFIPVTPELEQSVEGLIEALS